MRTAPFWSFADLHTQVDEPLDFRISLEDIIGSTGRIADGELANYSTNGVKFEKGDILFGKLRPYLAKYWLADRDGTAGGDIHVYRPHPVVEPRFLAYIVGSSVFVGFAEASSKGTKMPRAEWSAIREFRVPNHDLPTQRRIADYLDRETGEIDAMLAKLDALAEVLEGRKAREVDRVIGGLGDISWVQSKFLVQIQTGTGDTKDAADDGAYPFYVRSQVPQTHDSWEFEGPAVLTAGDGAGVGKVFHLVYGKFMAHQRVYVLDSFEGTAPEFFFHAFRRYFPEVATDGTAKATVDSVRLRMIADLRLPVPSIPEQERIADHLDEVTGRIDAMLAKVAQLKDLLIERRAALITAVVTGQKEVA